MSLHGAASFSLIEIIAGMIHTLIYFIIIVILPLIPLHHQAGRIYPFA
jgi:hypothetical protein